MINFKIFKKYHQKKIIFIINTIVITLTIALLVAYGNFLLRSSTDIANIKVSGMAYNLKINGIQNRIIELNNNDEFLINIILSSLNKLDSKYMLVYKVCADALCNNYINKPDTISVEYSNKTIDGVSGNIASFGTKQFRIALINTSSTDYYIELDIIDGDVNSYLASQNSIVNEYNEENLIIAAIVEGEITNTFPSTNDYIATVDCKTNKSESNASGTAIWNGTKWILNITGVDSGETTCNVNFIIPLSVKILNQEGGKDTIESKGTPDFSVINGTSGLYAAEDNYGISYYYRGLKTELNNNLIWGGSQWKIVRINGDGSIRIIYNGTENDFNLEGTMSSGSVNLGEREWNLSNAHDAKYVGYMYGGVNGTASTVRNGTSSSAATNNAMSNYVKSKVDDWYWTNFLNKQIESQIVDNIFCNDRQLASEVGAAATGPGYGKSATTNYAAFHRLVTTKTPTLKCAQKNDQFSVNNGQTIGNGSLEYPAGLLTADEAAMAGLVWNVNNQTNYLHYDIQCWVMSPLQQYYINSTNAPAIVMLIGENGDIASSWVNLTSCVRPVISIIPSIQVTGSGSLTNPYKAI